MAQQARQPRAPGESPYARKLARWRQEELRAGKQERPAPAPAPAPAAIAPVTDTRKTGTVKWFRTKAQAGDGFGFIIPDGGGKDVFIHVNDVARAGLDTLREGQRVSYDLGRDTGRGAPAINLALITN